MNKHSAIIRETSDYHEQLIASLKKKKEAKVYLQVALEEYEQEGDLEVFMLALRNVAEAQGGVNTLAKKAAVNRQNRIPSISSGIAIFSAISS